MPAVDLCHRYLAALDAGDLDAVLALFAPGAEVVSPLYGTKPAAEFYAALFADTEASDTTLLNIFDSAGDGGAVALHFRYGWTLADGTPVSFEVVDVIELTEARDAFARLTIIYDTAPLRADWSRVHDS
ncbi:MAG: nuclear transport factor 2 family protein [Maritimibacter sp.]|nr:nuclear transport factor 2 family protein [Maritimibacter sp.]